MAICKTISPIISSQYCHSSILSCWDFHGAHLTFFVPPKPQSLICSITSPWCRIPNHFSWLAFISLIFCQRLFNSVFQIALAFFIVFCCLLNFMVSFYNFFEHFILNYFIFVPESPSMDFLKGLNLILLSLLCISGGCIMSSYSIYSNPKGLTKLGVLFPDRIWVLPPGMKATGYILAS